MAVSKNSNSHAEVTVVVYSLKTLTGALGFDHAGIGPPATRAPKAVAFGHRIADEEIVGGAANGRALKPRTCIEGYAPNVHAAGLVRPETIEKAVDPIADLMTVESPVPSHPVFELDALDSRTTEQVGLVACIVDDCRTPPIGERGCGII